MSQDPVSHEQSVSSAGYAKRPGVLVIIAGLVTTMLTLLLVNVMNKSDIQPMSFYIFLIVPVGALLVGLLAGTGYAIGSWLTGAKIGGGLIVLVVILQVLSYFAAQYVEFRSVKEDLIQLNQEMLELIQQPEDDENGQPIDNDDLQEQLDNIARSFTFLQYFDANTRSFAFDGENGPGNPLGIWGYGIRLLELLGFSLGGLIGPCILMARPYCTQCQVYRKTKTVGQIPAGVKPRKLKKKDTEGQAAMEADVEQAFSGGLQLVEETVAMAQSGQSKEFCDFLTELKASKKEINKQSTHISVVLEYCPRCSCGRLVYNTVTGDGENTVTEEMASCDVAADFVRQALANL